jgi:hypothetical protein
LKKSVGGIFPVDEFTRDIDQDRIHPDHFKKESPLLITQYINNIIEQRYQQ